MEPGSAMHSASGGVAGTLLRRLTMHVLLAVSGMHYTVRVRRAPTRQQARRALYERFFDGFAAAGEPNIPIDRTLMAAPAFYDLLARLRQHAEEHQRDHWRAGPRRARGRARPRQAAAGVG